MWQIVPSDIVPNLSKEYKIKIDFIKKLISEIEEAKCM